MGEVAFEWSMLLWSILLPGGMSCGGGTYLGISRFLRRSRPGCRKSGANCRAVCCAKSESSRAFCAAMSASSALPRAVAVREMAMSAF